MNLSQEGLRSFRRADLVIQGQRNGDSLRTTPTIIDLTLFSHHIMTVASRRTGPLPDGRWSPWHRALPVFSTTVAD